MSVWQIPVATKRTSISASRGSSIVKVSIDMEAWGARVTAACIFMECSGLGYSVGSCAIEAFRVGDTVIDAVLIGRNRYPTGKRWMPKRL
jgi:hypothetical protein